jgi:RNA polymerase sigma-70 factor (ECF subfamily)
MDPHARIETADLLQHAGFLRRIARGLLGDEFRAEDVVQDVYATALERPPARRSFVRAWLGALARNRALNLGREERARSERERRAAKAETADSHEAATESLETQRLVCEQVLELDAEKRTVLHLRYYEDQSPSEIARRLGVPVKTVKSRLHRALGELRERMDARSHGRRSWVVALLPLARPRSAVALAAKWTALVAAASVLAIAVGMRVRALRAPPAAPSTGNELLAELDHADTVEPTALAPVETVHEEQEQTAVERPPATYALEMDLRWETDGTPAARVGVSARSPATPAPRVDPARVTSDENGRIHMEDLPPGKLLLRLDRGPERELELTAGETRFEWLVPAGTDVEGLVRNAAGEPVAGAEVWSERLLGDELVGWSVATTDARGEFRARGIGPVVRLVARARDHAPSRQVDVRELPLAASGARRAEFELGPSAVRVTGSVADDEGGPVVGALVRGGRHASASGTVTDAHGDFALPGDLDGYGAELVVIAPGFPVWKGSLDFEESEMHVDVVLERPATVRGRVLSTSGAGVAGAPCKADPASANRTPTARSRGHARRPTRRRLRSGLDGAGRERGVRDDHRSARRTRARAADVHGWRRDDV